MKRSISIEIEEEAKKMKNRHESSTQLSQYSAATPVVTKFLNTTTMASPVNINNNTIQEITDEELLEMALMFEKKEQHKLLP